MKVWLVWKAAESYDGDDHWVEAVYSSEASAQAKARSLVPEGAKWRDGVAYEGGVRLGRWEWGNGLTSSNPAYSVWVEDREVDEPHQPCCPRCGAAVESLDPHPPLAYRVDLCGLVRGGRVCILPKCEAADAGARGVGRGDA